MGARTAIIRDNEVTTQNHSGGGRVLQDLSNKTIQRAPDGARRLDGKRRSNSIGFAQQLNNSYMVRPALQGKSLIGTKERLHTYIRPSIEAEYSFWP